MYLNFYNIGLFSTPIAQHFTNDFLIAYPHNRRTSPFNIIYLVYIKIKYICKKLFVNQFVEWSLIIRMGELEFERFMFGFNVVH